MENPKKEAPRNLYYVVIVFTFSAYSFLVAMVFKGKCGATKATKKTRRKTFLEYQRRAALQPLFLLLVLIRVLSGYGFKGKCGATRLRK
jgi:hypothetical protein